jgi:ribosome-interacting GTPase 1
LSQNLELYKQTKHINICYHFLREGVIEVKDLYITRVVKTENIANALTKPLASKQFIYFINKIRVVNIENLDNLDYKVNSIDGINSVNSIYNNNSDLDLRYKD